MYYRCCKEDLTWCTDHWPSEHFWAYTYESHYRYRDILNIFGAMYCSKTEHLAVVPVDMTRMRMCE